MRLVEQAVARATWPTPSARKSGRDPRWPYVPLLVFAPIDGGRGYTTQVRARAYATRDEAVAHATQRIENMKRTLAERLLDRGARSLREQHGLPRELDDLHELETRK